MTPVLYGRWQTRLFLLSTLGVLLTAFFAILYQDFQTTFALLAYVFIFGLGWDVLYHLLLRLRWDRDWAPHLFPYRRDMGRRLCSGPGALGGAARRQPGRDYRPIRGPLWRCTSRHILCFSGADAHSLPPLALRRRTMAVRQSA